MLFRGLLLIVMFLSQIHLHARLWVEQDEVTVGVGYSVQVFYESNNSYANIYVSHDNEEVIKIISEKVDYDAGIIVVRGIKPGISYISIYESGSVSPAVVKVTVEPLKPIAAITISDTPIRVTRGDCFEIRPYVYPAFSDFSSLRVYSSAPDDFSVGISYHDGNYINVSTPWRNRYTCEGTLTAQYDNVSSSCRVTSEPLYHPATEMWLHEGVVNKGRQIDLYPNFYNGEYGSLSPFKEHKWTVGNQGILSINSSNSMHILLSALEEGKTDISFWYQFHYDDEWKTYNDKASWEVVDLETRDNMRGIMVKNKKLDVSVGQFINLRARACSGTELSGDGSWRNEFPSKIVYSIDNKSVVDFAYPNGVFYALNPGVATITVKCGGLQIPVMINVSGNSDINEISVEPNDCNANDTSNIEWYTIDGVKIGNPRTGLYIRRTGPKVEKVYLK